MNLSNRLTFSLVFSVFLVAAFAIVPNVMAAEDGPTATFTVVDTMTTGDPDGPDDDMATTADNIPPKAVLDGDNILLTNDDAVSGDDRSDIADPDEAGQFQLILTFNQDIYNAADAATQATGDFDTTELGAADFVATVYSVATGQEVTGGVTFTVTRVDTVPDVTGEADTQGIQGDKRKFLVAVDIAAATADDAPFIIRVQLNADAGAFSKATAAGVIDGVIQDEVPGVNNQMAVAQFTVIPKKLLRPSVTTSASEIGLDETVTVTMTFDPAPAAADQPTRGNPDATPPVPSNLKVTNGSILPDDPETDGDDGLSSNEDGTVWTIVIVPQGGIGDFYKLKVEAVDGAPFILSQEITVDSRPLSQQIDITGPTADNRGPQGGGEFTVTITYTVAPSTDLTAAGVTVTGGTKGTFTKTGPTTYTIVVDPTDPAAGATGTLTVAVGQYSQDFSIPGTDVVDPIAPTDETSRITSDTITVPKNSFVVVVRQRDLVPDDANDPTTVGDQRPEGLIFRSDVTVAEWPTMPNLETLFDRSAPGGGGALVVEEVVASGGTASVAVGRVGISEIMWGIDEGKLGDEDGEKASQWIELQNLTDKDASIMLHSLTGRDITSDTKITGTLASPIIDVVTNFFNNRPGNPAWNVPGNSGNSVSGGNFVSMARILPDKKDAYADADGARFSNRDGRAAGHWSASSSAYLRKSINVGDVTVVYEYHGTPGRVNSFKPATQPHLKDSRTNVPSNSIVINEVANRSNAQRQYEWIELRNVSGGQINLRKYIISKVTSNSVDQILIDFPNNDNAKVDAGKVLLLVASDPATDPDHPLAVGYNVDKSAAEQVSGLSGNPVRYKVISFQHDGLPDNGEFVLIIRRPDNAGKNDGAERGANDLDKIVDIAGYHPNLARSGYSNAVSSTKLWPLRAFDSPSFGHNKLALNEVHRRQRTTTHNGRSGVGAHENKGGEGEAAFRNVGWTGVGYRRHVAPSNIHGGTPGYDNGALHGAGGTITGAVYISEIMLADGPAGALPQWIELRNPSKTAGADLHNWRLTIINHDSTDGDEGLWDGKAEAFILLRNLKIKPNSTVLITSARAPRSLIFLPNADIFTLFPAHRNTFGMTGPGDDVINTYGFKITLHANAHDNNKPQDWQLVDQVSNLAEGVSDRRGNRQRFDPPRWAWPNGDLADGTRVSLTRTNVVSPKAAGDGFDRALSDGTMEAGWMLSSMDSRTERIDLTYYGNKNDISTPGQTVKSPLPVSLSYFRPTLENDEVVIRWTTESELENAGFNILRSESRDGEFKQVNAELIQGNGTTGERSTYKWVDETAKPNVHYFYQIEDVSFAGERQTLRTIKLKGLITAENKLTTKWGELKSQD